MRDPDLIGSLMGSWVLDPNHWLYYVMCILKTEITERAEGMIKSPGGARW